MPRFKSRDFGTSLLFNGTTDTVVIPHNANQLLTGGFTFSAWIRPRSFGETAGVVIDKSTGTSGNGGWRWCIDPGANRMMLGINAGTNVFASSQSLRYNSSWYFVAVTVDSNALVTHYVNGVTSGTPATGGALSGITTTNALTIGNRSSATDRTFDGGIDEPRIWNRVLTAQEISDLCFNGTYSTTGLIGEYLFNEGTGTVAMDSTASTNNGAITGATYSRDVPMKSRFLQRNANAAILVNGIDGAAGNGLSIPNNASLSPTAAVTLEIRFRPTAQKPAILFDNSTTGVTNSYYLSLSADGALYWYSTIGGVSKNITGTTTKVKLNEWNMVSATYDGAAIKLFLNGAQLPETLTATGSMGTNSGALRIGAYYSGGTSQTFQGSLSQPRVYATSCTLAEHQDRYYRGITSTALQAALVLDLDTNRGAGTTVLDLSGLGNNATMGASASWTSDVPFKARKASVNANMVKNGDFEYAPPFTAATTTASRWIDGTASGSTTNDLFGWFMSPSWTGTDGTASFDSSVFYAGAYSLKINKTSATGGTSGGAVGLGVLVSPSSAVQRQYFCPVTPSTDYRLTFRLKTDSISALNAAGARMRALMYDGVSTSSTSSASSSYVTGTNDWQQITLSFTTTATTRLINPWCQLDNETGTAWFDDIVLLPVYPEGRVPANGNLVKNFDFEVAPTFVAAQTTSGRWMDGTSGGSTTNSTYKWAFISKSGTGQIQFDSSVSRSGTNSLKVSTTDVSSNIEAASVISNTAANMVFAIPVSPGVSYTGTYWMKTNYVSGDATNGANMDFITRNAASTALTVNATTKVKTTTDWTQYTVTFTADATANFVTLRPKVDGLTGTGTLIMDAWFDDIYLAPTTNPGRVLIT